MRPTWNDWPKHSRHARFALKAQRIEAGRYLTLRHHQHESRKLPCGGLRPQPDGPSSLASPVPHDGKATEGSIELNRARKVAGGDRQMSPVNRRHSAFLN